MVFQKRDDFELFEVDRESNKKVERAQNIIMDFLREKIASGSLENEHIRSKVQEILQKPVHCLFV